METRIIKLRIGLYGKAPAKYGANAYKVGLGERALLVRAGWSRAGSGRGYEYAIPPDGVKPGRHYVAEVAVPTDDEIKALALSMHAERKSQVTQVAGFVAKYQPAGVVLYTVKAMGGVLVGGYGYPPSEEQVVRSKHAEFEIGIMSPWSVKLIWESGEDAEATWYRHGKEDGT